MPANGEDATGDRRARFPALLGVAGWQVVRLLARRRHDIEVHRVDGHRMEPGVGRTIGEVHADADTVLRSRHGIVQHGGNEKRVTRVHTVAEDSGQIDRGRLRPKGPDAKHDRTEQLPLLRDNQVHVVDQRVRQQSA